MTSTSTLCYIISANCGDVADFRSLCAATGGQWFLYGTGLDLVLDRIVDDFAEFESISITVTNTSGATIAPLYVQLIPDTCITIDVPGLAVQSVPSLPAGGSASFTWDITEIPHCNGWGDCFFISAWGGGHTDSLAGCFFIEDCGCPGPEAVIIEPVCGIITACTHQQIIIEIRSYLPVNTSSIRLNVNGSILTITSPGMSYDPATRRLTYTPPSPWTHGSTVNFTLTQAEDITGCAMTYTNSCNFIVDIRPPEVTGWGFSPACGSAVTGSTIISFNGWARDDPAGMTLFDELSSTSGLSGLVGSFTAVYLTMNGIPYIGFPGIGYELITPHIGFPLGRMDTTRGTLSSGMSPGPFAAITNFTMTNIICTTLPGYPSCGPEDWRISLSCPASTIQAWALGARNVEFCVHFKDLVESRYCGPNDTSFCCNYVFPTGCPQAVTSIICPYPCGGWTSCENQFMEFSIADTSGTASDTMRVHFTVNINRLSRPDTRFIVSEPSPYSWFTGTTGSRRAFVGNFPWSDGDTVTIRLDSLYTTDGCVTRP